MLPIFNKYANMLKSFNIDLSSYGENKLWIDRLIIKGIKKDGSILKICRLKVDDELGYKKLNYKYKFYTNLPSNEELETWEESYQRLKSQIKEREREFTLASKYRHRIL